MTAQEQSGDEPRFVDRSGWLIVFGSVEIVIGALCALMVPLIVLGMLLSAAAPSAQSQPMNLRMMIPAGLIYGVAAVFFIWIGIGTFTGRRWAWAIMLVVSWLWLLGGLLGMVFWLLMAPNLVAATTPGAPPVPDTIRAAITAVMTAFMAVIYVLLPGAFVLFYRSKNVKATFDYKDPRPRWTDRCPLPVLAVSLVLGYGALFCLLGLGYGVFPLFGRVLTGLPAAAMLLIFAVVLGYLAREVYRLQIAAWWGVVALGVLTAVSGILTFRQTSVLDLYKKMGFSGPQLEMIRSMRLWERFNIPLFTLMWGVVVLGYLVSVRKYFDASIRTRDPR